MDNNINFKGAFFIRKPSPQLKDALLPMLKECKQPIIYENIKNDSMLCVVNKGNDRDIANAIIQTPNVRFQYYPKLTTKSGFKKDSPSEALQILKSAKETALSTKEKLLNAIRNPNNLHRINLIRIQERNLKLIQAETFKDFKPNIDNGTYKKNIDPKTGMCTISTDIIDKITGRKMKHILVEITPPGKYGICYAKYTPISTDDKIEKTLRIAINKNGEKIFEYTNPTSPTFKINSNLAKQYYTEHSSPKI